MNSSFGTTVARHRRPHFGHCLASGPLADQLCTSKFGEREILTAIYWGLLKQPDNQKAASSGVSRSRSEDPHGRPVYFSICSVPRFSVARSRRADGRPSPSPDRGLSSV